MRTLRTALFTLALLFPFASPLLAQDAIAPETMTVEVIPAGTPKLFVADLAITNIVDGKIYVYHADDLKVLGTLGLGFMGQMYVPAARDVVYVSTSYVEKISRGKRSDFLEVYDSSALTLRAEIPIASTRTQALNFRPLMQGSVDSRWMFIQNATPATSISVVDLEAGKQVAEIPNPGCWGIYPSAKDGRRFATMCGDGTFGSYTLSEDGSEAERTASEAIFDPAGNALFSHGERDGDTWLFITFAGDLYRVNLEGDTAALVDQSTFAAEGWRPGGYQPHAYHQATGTLFVLMHPNGAEGSHKNPGEEIWAYDVAGKKLLSRSPTTTAFALGVGGQEGAPALYAANQAEGKVHRYTADAAAAYALTETGAVAAGEVPMQLETQ